MILNASHSKPLPVPGGGLNEQDWIHVEDRASRLEAVLECGQIGQMYLLGGWGGRDNRALVKSPYPAFDRLRLEVGQRERLITFVADRSGHDQRSAIDCSKAERDLDWAPPWTFKALEETVAWWHSTHEGGYKGDRLDLATALTEPVC